MEVEAVDDGVILQSAPVEVGGPKRELGGRGEEHDHQEPHDKEERN